MESPRGDAVKPRAAHPPSAHAGRTCLPASSWESSRWIAGGCYRAAMA